jgi:hypothetical protein
VLAELLDEAEFLRNGDLSGLRQENGVLADGIQGRYCDASRASRRSTVERWIATQGHRYRPAHQRALDMIGGLS